MPEPIATATTTVGPMILVMTAALILLAVGAIAATAGAWHRATLRADAPLGAATPPNGEHEGSGTVLR